LLRRIGETLAPRMRETSALTLEKFPYRKFKMSVYEVSDLKDDAKNNEVKKILSRLALARIFISYHVSDDEILKKYGSMEILDRLLKSKNIGYSWLVDQENYPSNIMSPPEDLEKAVQVSNNITGPTLMGFLSYSSPVKFSYAEANRKKEFVLGQIRGSKTIIYNRTTLIRMLMVFGYFYFEGDVGSATRLVDWELRFNRNEDKMSPAEFSSYMRTKAYLSGQSKDSLMSLLRRKIEMKRDNENDVLKGIPMGNLTKDMLISSIIDYHYDIFRLLGRNEVGQEGSLSLEISNENTGNIDDMGIFKGDSREAIGNRYRRSITFKVPTLKLLEDRKINNGGFDQTVYSVISRNENIFILCMMIEYLLQDIKGIDNLGGGEAAPIIDESSMTLERALVIEGIFQVKIVNEDSSAFLDIVDYMRETFLSDLYDPERWD